MRVGRQLAWTRSRRPRDGRRLVAAAIAVVNDNVPRRQRQKCVYAVGSEYAFDLSGIVRDHRAL